MEIPYDRLSPEALRGLAEAFVSAEGTDYGEREASLEEKIAQVIRQIEKDDVLIGYDADSQTCWLFPRNR